MSASVNNLSDRQYCCVWHVEVLEDGYRPDVARALLAKVARHVNPVLRDRGWRVKRLIESTSRSWIGCCTTNGRNDADAASVNIQLNLRVSPDKWCRQFRTFRQIVGVMLHEIAHTSIGLEDIHPPAFWDLLRVIKQEYAAKLANGEVAAETDSYGCREAFVSQSGQVTTVETSAEQFLNAGSGGDSNNDELSLDGGKDCGARVGRGRRGRRCRGNGAGAGRKRQRRPSNGRTGTATKAVGIKAAEQQQAKRRPLLKGAKMIDKRTSAGKMAMAARTALAPRELAARAALQRFGGGNGGGDSVFGGGGHRPTSSTAATDTQGATASALASSSNGGNRSDEDGDDQSAVGDDERAENDSDSDSDQSEDDEEEETNVHEEDRIAKHQLQCACRACEWDKMFVVPGPKSL